MKARPILFKPDMVRAILDGRKTQTRRIVKPLAGAGWRPETAHGDALRLGKITSPHPKKGRFGLFMRREIHPGSGKYEHDLVPCPYGAPGDVLVPAVEIPLLGRAYCADISGNIWSRAKGEWRRLKGSPNSRGYLTVTPAVDGKYKTRAVHRLVCEAFYGAAPTGMSQVRHLDGDRLSNPPHNLDWGTQEQNWLDRAAHGGGMGEAHHASKLTAGAAAEIRASSASQRALAARYGVSQSQIYSVKSGKTWAEDRRPAPSNLERWTNHLTLEITDVRVERLQDISEDDAECEGVTPATPPEQTGARHKPAFRHLWEDINGEESWAANPWVWVVEFQPHHTNVDAFLRGREVA
jgi:hypothetical protein